MYIFNQSQQSPPWLKIIHQLSLSSPTIILHHKKYSHLKLHHSKNFHIVFTSNHSFKNYHTLSWRMYFTWNYTTPRIFTLSSRFYFLNKDLCLSFPTPLTASHFKLRNSSYNLRITHGVENHSVATGTRSSHYGHSRKALFP